jgi:hypothetical protein
MRTSFSPIVFMTVLMLWGSLANAQHLDSLGSGAELYTGRVVLGADIRFKKPAFGTWKVLVDSQAFIARDVRFVRSDTLLWANIVHLRKLTGAPQWALRSRKGVLSEYEMWRTQVGFDAFSSVAFAYPRKERFYSKNGGPLVRNVRAQLWSLLDDHPKSLKALKSSRRYAWIGAVGILGGMVAAGLGADAFTKERMHEGRPPFGLVAGAIGMWGGGVSFLVARAKLRQAVKSYWKPR